MRSVSTDAWVCRGGLWVVGEGVLGLDASVLGMVTGGRDCCEGV